MGHKFLEIATTPSVHAAQVANGSAEQIQRWIAHGSRKRAFDRFSEHERAFIGERDSFYLASVSETGWPYVQHRGGPPGFLKILDDHTLAFADLSGNRQYITVGNVAADNRVALIMIDYPSRARLKLLGHMTAHDLRAEPELAARVALPGYDGEPERAFTIELESFDWNCSQHIVQRYTRDEIETAIAPLYARIAELEAETARLRGRS